MNSPIPNRLEYRKQLESEQWAAFAADVKRSRNYCESCRRKDVGLQVHHIFYDFDRKLTDYSPDELVVLCSGCHREMHEQLKAFRKHVFKHLNPQSFRILNGALAVALEAYQPLLFCHALAEFASNERLVNNHAKAWTETEDQKRTFVMNPKPTRS